jgi:hypothetical protein
MRLIWIILLSNLVCFSQDINLNDLRNSFIEADQSKEKCKILLDQSSEIMDNNNIAKAYYAAAIIISSQYKINPIDKWNNFKIGKNKLEEQIKRDYQNLEMRFLRYCMQKKAPSFLGYQENIEEDKKILQNIKDNTDKDLINFINPILIKLYNE